MVTLVQVAKKSGTNNRRSGEQSIVILPIIEKEWQAAAE